MAVVVCCLRHCRKRPPSGAWPGGFPHFTQLPMIHGKTLSHGSLRIGPTLSGRPDTVLCGHMNVQTFCHFGTYGADVSVCLSEQVLSHQIQPQSKWHNPLVQYHQCYKRHRERFLPQVIKQNLEKPEEQVHQKNHRPSSRHRTRPQPPPADADTIQYCWP